MKNLIFIKKLYLIAFLLIANVFAASASIVLSGFSINGNYLVSGRLNVTDPSVKLPFKFSVSLTRPGASGGGYIDGSCTISLVWKPDVSSSAETVISTAKNVTNSNYVNAFADISNIDATLPANTTYGVVLIKWTFYNTDQQKMVTEYEPRGVVAIQFNPAKVPIYLLAGQITGDYCLGISEPGTGSKWFSRGIDFYAFKVQPTGGVPIYEYQGHVNDANGEPEFPENITYYATSLQEVLPVLPGLGSAWTTVTPKILFYAYPTQVAGTVPVYCYSNAAKNNFLFMATGEIADTYSVYRIAFYAYPVQ